MKYLKSYIIVYTKRKQRRKAIKTKQNRIIFAGKNVIIMHCIACGAPIRGRVDKRFCDDACRSGFHNQKNREHDFFVSKINKILKKNRKILAVCHNQNSQTVLVRKLMEEGFVFGYYTEIEVKNGKKGHTCFCYEYGYRPINKTEIEIIRKQS